METYNETPGILINLPIQGMSDGNWPLFNRRNFKKKIDCVCTYTVSGISQLTDMQTQKKMKITTYIYTSNDGLNVTSTFLM